MAPPEEKKKKGSNWIGALIFFLIFAGPAIVRSISNLLSQVSGGTISLGPNIIPVIVFLVIVLVIISRVFSAVGRFAKQNESPSSASNASIASSSNTSLQQYTGGPDSLRQYTGGPDSLRQYTGGPESLRQYTGGPDSLRQYTSPQPVQQRGRHVATNQLSTIRSARTASSSTASTSMYYDDDDDDDTLDWSDSTSLYEAFKTASGNTANKTGGWQHPPNLPAAPRFEPVLSGKVLLFGILGILLLGGVFAATGVAALLLP